MTNHKKRVQVPEFVHPTTGTEPTVWSLLNNITWYTTSMTLNLTLKLHSFLCSSNQILRIIQTTPPSSDGSNLEDFSSWKEDSMERRWNKNCVVRWYLSVDFIRHQIPCLNCRSCSCFSVSCSNKLKAWGEMFKRVKPRDLFGLFKNFVESALVCLALALKWKPRNVCSVWWWWGCLEICNDVIRGWIWGWRGWGWGPLVRNEFILFS